MLFHGSFLHSVSLPSDVPGSKKQHVFHVRRANDPPRRQSNSEHKHRNSRHGDNRATYGAHGRTLVVDENAQWENENGPRGNNRGNDAGGGMTQSNHLQRKAYEGPDDGNEDHHRHDSVVATNGNDRRPAPAESDKEQVAEEGPQERNEIYRHGVVVADTLLAKVGITRWPAFATARFACDRRRSEEPSHEPGRRPRLLRADRGHTADPVPRYGSVRPDVHRYRQKRQIA